MSAKESSVMNPNHPEKKDDPSRETEQFSLPPLTPLIVMLGIFLTIALVTIFAILDREPSAHKLDTGGLQAYGPADFPEIEFEIPPPDLSAAADPGAAFSLPPPPFSDESIFPCSDCHEDMDPNPTRRVLEEFHEEIVLNHGPKERWCFDCHDPDDRDSLRLANGIRIGFEESYRLCGQCHGTIFRDWREGIHGRRRGYWNGVKTYLLCAHCHDPHAPHFREIAPLPPRIRPELMGHGGERTEG